MNKNEYIEQAEKYLKFLCALKPDRRVGSIGNRRAVEFFIKTVNKCGFHPEQIPFKCMDYKCTKIRLSSGDHIYDVQASPYSNPCNIEAGVIKVTNIQELESVNCKAQILFLADEICKEQLMPKNFVFYNPEHHKKIIALLEKKQPAAIITATKKNPETAGALYPFPLIEDGDFNIPSVFCTHKTGKMIINDLDKPFKLIIKSTRIPSTAMNAIARKNMSVEKRIIICAHIDAKENTPGALDNASGVVVLLLLMEMLKNYTGKTGIEILPFNGEDHYSVGGQMAYLKKYRKSLKNVHVAINIDAAGYIYGKSAYSFYKCTEEIKNRAEKVFSLHRSLIEGDPWYQGDHSIFYQNNVPAIAITSQKFMKLTTDINHTEKDKPELVNIKKLFEIADSLYQFIIETDRELNNK